MKITKSTLPKEGVNYPRLMASPMGNVFLVTGTRESYYEGTCVFSCGGAIAGKFYNDLNLSLTNYNGTISMSNDD